MPSSTLKATFIGVSTILFDDGIDAILIDGYFTRPPIDLQDSSRQPIASDEEAVASGLQEANIQGRLHAVLVAHSHVDHVLDAPTVCKQTGAKLVGSTSTKMVGAGYGLPETQMTVVSDGQSLTFGAFRVFIVQGLHSPGDIAPGDIASPIKMPCDWRDLRTGKCYSFSIEHGGNKSIFVHPSANYVPGKLEHLRASTVFLGVGALGKQNDDFRANYWEEVVRPLKPKRIVPVHWDNLFGPANLPLCEPYDNVLLTQTWLSERCKTTGIDFRIQYAGDVLEIVD